MWAFVLTACVTMIGVEVVPVHGVQRQVPLLESFLRRCARPYASAELSFLRISSYATWGHDRDNLNISCNPWRQTYREDLPTLMPSSISTLWKNWTLLVRYTQCSPLH